MKKQISVSFLILFLIFMGYTACDDTPALPEESISIEYLPQFGGWQSSSRAIELEVLDQEDMVESMLIHYQPLLTGFNTNELNLGLDDSFTFSVYNKTCKVEIDLDLERESIVFSGSFPDDLSYFELNYYYNSHSFDYKQYLIIADAPVNTDIRIGQASTYVVFENVTINDRSYHAMPVKAYLLQNENISTSNVEIYSGYNHDKSEYVSGYFLYDENHADQQPDLSEVDLDKMPQEEMVTYFSDCQNWEDISIANSLGYYNWNTKKLYSNAYLPIGNLEYTQTVPWDLFKPYSEYR